MTENQTSSTCLAVFKLKFEDSVAISPDAKFISFDGPLDPSIYTKGKVVKLPTGLEFFCSDEFFKKNFIIINDNDSLPEESIDAFIKNITFQKLGEKTLLAHATLVNGFEIVEASSCVNPDNYDEEIGKSICLDKIRSKVWQLLGFLLQTGVGGVNLVEKIDSDNQVLV